MIFRRELHFSLVLLATVPAFCLLLLILATTTFARLDEQLGQYEASAEQMTSQLAASVDYALISNQPALLDNALRSLLAQPGVMSIRILDQSGLPWLVRSGQAAHSPANLRRFSAAIERPRPLPDPDDWLSPAEAPVGGSDVIGRVEITFDVGSLWRREMALVFQLVLIGVAALIFIGSVSWLVAVRISRRQEQLAVASGEAARLTREQLRERELRWQQEQERQEAWGKWSHDIRTPLHGVSGMLELLSGTPLDAEQSRYLEQAREAARAMEDGLQAMPAPTDVPARAVESAHLAAAEKHWLGRRVLLVEDDLISQHLLRGILEPWGVDLVCAGTGAEALDRRGEHWDLVLVDGELPDMNAADLARAWAASKSGRGSRDEAQLVAITAHSDPDRLETYRAAGLDPVLSKPLRRSHLLSVLTPLLAGSS